ncbi:FAD-dependent oxidoreductase [Calycomorphotria hydatis]|uniref:Nitrite reductase [NAD(P)H] n=1 Tax=Calycomorphotria hydatis TaxID=2528027 RepID=A0A517TA02_9PLAN|nr:FAD-dependent oxidoreductase [Calycomorphotria hydatis]QDT65189.1 Nitrite reductase [NAD(P)H] [Calycomorphotria hydatis]
MSLTVTDSEPVPKKVSNSFWKFRAPVRPVVVVIGNGPVGWKLCEQMVHRKGHLSHEIHVFGEESRLAYDRVQLTSFFQHRSEKKLTLADQEWYDEHGIQIRTNDPIIKIHSEQKTVESRSGQVIPYDQVVIATGSRAFLPPIPGIDSQGVHAYRTLDDVDRITSELDRLKESASPRVGIIGGGLLGLEAARAVHDCGVEAHVFETAAVLMPKQLDTKAAELLQSEINSIGVKIHTTARTQAITTNDAGQLELHLDGEEAPFTFDMILVSAGIRPRDEVAKDSGINTHARGGIIVTDRLETSVPDVYAIGECAVHNDQIYGLVAPGFHMAGVVAERLTTRLPIKPTFKGHDNATRLKLLGVDVITLGDYLQIDSATYPVTHEGPKSYCKLILKANRLRGAMIVGEYKELPRLTEAIDAGRRVSGTQLRRFAKEGRLWKEPDATHISEWPAGATVCSCMGVKRGELTKAYESGCETVDAMIRKTQAGTVCGSCRPLLAELIGSPETAGGVAGWRFLGMVSLLSMFTAALLILIGAPAYSSSVQSIQYEIDQFLLNDFWKQVTGYTLVGVAVIAAALSIRKRWKKLTIGTYGLWRVFHSVMGLICLVGLAIHTGMHFGANLNLLLMLSFLGTLIVGACTGYITSIESRAGKPPPAWVKKWRPRLTWAHVIFTWPLPALITFHILSFYLFAD